MYLLCYGRSENAKKTGDYLMEVLGGRWIDSADFFSSRAPLIAQEKDAVIVMLLPLEASIQILNESFSPTLMSLPVICVSPERKFACILKKGDDTTLADSKQTIDAITKLLGPDCFKDFGGNQDIAPDFMSVVDSYNMKPNDEQILEEVNRYIKEGGRVSLYSDLPITFAEPCLDSMIFDVNRYSFNQRESFAQAYISECVSNASQPAIFVTCSKLPDREDSHKPLVLTPKLMAIGIELNGRIDSRYATEFVWDTLLKHGINPEAVSTVAVSSVAKDNDAVHEIAEKLGASVTAFSSKTLKDVRVPLKMTFTPEKGSADLCTQAACLASDGGRILVRRAGGRDGVIFTCALRKGNISFTE